MIKRCLLLLIFLLTAFSSLTPAAQTLEFKDIPIETEIMAKQKLLTQTLELYGPNAGQEFYYELSSDLDENEDYYIQLEITKSNLLIKPSSLTIEIDSVPVHTVSLESEEVETIKVKLEGEALKKGIHTINTIFEGYIHAGLCVPDNVTGNWVAIQPNSYINIKPHTFHEQPLDLSVYPKLYRGELGNEITVILPLSSSVETLQSAHMVGNFLSGLSEQDTVKVLYEDEVKKIKGNILLVGSTEEFQLDWTNAIIKNHLSEIDEGSIYISQNQLKQEDQEVTAMVVLAKDSKDISSNISILTNQQFIEQLSGNTVQLSELPSVNISATQNEIAFHDFGLNDVMLDGFNRKTANYYYYLPMDKQLITNPSLELHLKRSGLLKSSEQTPVEGSIVKEEVDLIVYLNQVPHSVNISSEEENSSGNIVVNIPFDKDILRSDRLVSIQLEARGLYHSNPCIKTDQTKWLYVLEDSKFILPTGERQENELLIDSFPYPFADHETELTIVIPDSGLSNEEIQILLRALTTNNSLPTITIVESSDVTEDLLKKGNIIFIGSVSKHEILKEQSQLILEYDGGRPLLGQMGFIEPQVEFYSFIQNNPWNKQMYMMIFDSLNGTEKYISEGFLSYLRSTNNKASIAVQTGIDSFYTNTVQLEIQSEEVESTLNNVVASNQIWWVISFGLLLIISFMLIIYYRKRQK